MACNCNDLRHTSDNKYICDKCGKRWKFNRWHPNGNYWEEASQSD